MEKSKLTKLCSSMKIQRKELGRKRLDEYGKQHFDEDYLIRAMTELDEISEGNLIVMGGFCACSKILGFRKMRRTSNDLDCTTNEEGLNLLYQRFGAELFQTTDYGDVFLEYQGIPVGFDIDETHGWKIPESFEQDARRFSFETGNLTSISPEFLITLKARRSILKNRFYGKDAVDSLNILLAPFYKPELPSIDTDKLGNLFRQHSSSSQELILSYLDFISKYSLNLRKEEIPIVEKFFPELLNSVKKAYNP